MRALVLVLALLAGCKKDPDLRPRNPDGTIIESDNCVAFSNGHGDRIQFCPDGRVCTWYACVQFIKPPVAEACPAHAP